MKDDARAGSLADAVGWMSSRGHLLIPLALTVWIAWGDLRTRRIPNYLTLGTAVAGLAFNFMSHGLPGWRTAFWGCAWDSPASSCLTSGAAWGPETSRPWPPWGPGWGPKLTLLLFCYMGIAGGVIAVGYLVWQGSLWEKIKQGWTFLLNLMLCRPDGPPRPPSPADLTEGIPYGVAIAVGMLVLVGVRGTL